MIRAALVLLLLTDMLAAACLPMSRTRGSYIYFPGIPAVAESARKDPAAVNVFFKRDPDRSVVEIGIVEAVATGLNVSLQMVFPELTRQAGLMGADAIYKIELQRYDHAGDAMYATAIAIRYQ